MTAEDAAALLEAFRKDSDDAPSVDPRVLAYAYLNILGSLAPEENAFSR